MKKILEIIKTYSGYFFAIVAVVAFIYAAGVKGERKDSGTAMIVQTQTIVLDSIKSISRQMQSVQSDLVTIKEKQIEAKNAYNSLRLVVLDMASKSPGMTIEQILNYVNSVPELKKKSLTNQIPYRQETLISSKLK